MADGRVIIDALLDTENIQKGINSINSLAKKGLGVATGAAAAVGTALIGIGTASTMVGMNFEASMSQVAATMGITADEINNGSESFEMLEQAAKDAGATTKYSASESAEALNYLALAGYDAEKSVTALPKVLDLAAAGGLDLAYASDLVTDSMSALGLETKDLDGFVDELAKTSQKSNTSVAQLGEAILTVGGTAKVLAGGTNEMNTALGILADNGIKGAEGGTALRNVILSLSSPTDQAALKMQELGLEVFDAEGNMRPLNDTFGDLDGILSTMNQGEQTQVLSELFNKVDLKSVNALLANSGERFDELSGHIANADGSAANMAETMQNNLKGKMEIIGSSMEGLGIQIYEKLEGPLKQAAETAIEAMGNLSDDLSNGALGESVDNLAEGFGNMITAISEGAEKWLPKIIDGLTWVMDNAGTIASLIGAIVVGLTAMNVANMIHGVVKAFQAYKAKTEGATVAQWLLNVAMSANPVGIVIALILALVAGIVVLWNTNEDFRNALIGAWEAIKACGVAVWEWVVKVFTETIPNAFNAVVDFFANNWQTILGFIINPLGTAFSWCYENLEGFRTFIDTIVENVKTFIMNGFNAIGNFFTETIPQWIENIGTWFSELPYKIGFAIGQALGSIIQWGADCRDYLETNVPLWINSVVTFFSELPGKIWDWLVNTFNKVVTWGSDMWAKVTEVVTTFISKAVTVISELPGKIWSWLVNTYNRVVQWGTDLWAKATEVASRFVNNIINFIKELPSKVWNWFTQTISKVISFGSDAGTKAKEAGGKIVDNVINAVKNLPSKIFDIGKNIVEGLWNGITSMGSWISDKVGGFFSGIVDGAKSVLGIHSPSRVFRDQVGKYMAEGVGVGFEDEAKHVQLDMNKSLSALTAKMSATVQADMNIAGARSTGTAGGTLVNNAPIAEKLEKLIAMFNQFVNQTIPTYKIIMDTGALVGELAPGINRELALASEYRERGR